MKLPGESITKTFLRTMAVAAVASMGLFLRIWIAINATPQLKVDEERPSQVFVIVQDVTERKRAEAERDKLENQLRHGG